MATTNGTSILDAATGRTVGAQAVAYYLACDGTRVYAEGGGKVMAFDLA